MIIRVPLYLSSRCGVWIRISSSVFIGQVDVLLEDGRLVARVLVQADLADAEHVGLVEELGDDGDDLAREADVLGLLGVDAQPASSGWMPNWAARFGSTSVRWRK